MGEDQDYYRQIDASMQDDLCASWSVGWAFNETERQIINRFGRRVCTIEIDPLDRHAALIKAAPDMLAALQDIVANYDRFSSHAHDIKEIAEARSIIDKATKG